MSISSANSSLPSVISKQSMDQYHVFRVFQQNFVVDKRFQLIKGLGQGAYGIVCSAKYSDPDNSFPADESSGNVAIKKVTNIFSKKILCKRALREIKLLRHFRGHKNITCLYDLDIVPNDASGNFNEIYLYEELMECDMHQIIRSSQPLTDSHYQSFIYQILCGLKYIHSADVLHRDLKPGNLLVNADCELKICDFGLARGYSSDPEKNQGFLTEYVATRWYRAPEIILSFQGYTKAIDMWSVGCILAELLGGTTLFKGRDYVDQLNEILKVLGTPDEETLQSIKSTRAQAYVRSLPYMPAIPFQTKFPNATPASIDLLTRMLTIDPRHRISVEEALEHPYLEIWHDVNDEPACSKKFDFAFEEVDDIKDMRQMIIDEIQSFREYVRKPLEEQEIVSDNYGTQDELLEQQQQQQQQLLEQQLLQQQAAQAQLYQQQLAQQQQQQQAMVGMLTTPTSNDLFNSGDYEMPPRPEEMDALFGSSTNNTQHNTNPAGGTLNLEQELQFGLDGFGNYRQ